MGKKQYKKKRSKFFIILLGILFILVIPLSIVLVKQSAKQQEEINAQTCQALPLHIPVLVLGYFPPDPNNPNQLDPVETGWDAQKINQYGGFPGFNLTDWHNTVDEITSTLLTELTDNTRYHGYKDSSAPPFLTWDIVDKKYFDTKIPKGVPDSDPGNPYLPNYNQILTNQNICNYVDNQGVKEVWIYSYHSNTVTLDESRMSSKYGDISNSHGNLDPSVTLPTCKNSYTLYNYEYYPDKNTAVPNTIHDRMHQIEDIVSYADGHYNETTPAGLFWGNFATYTGQGKPIACSTTHRPPNSSQDYDYANTNSVSSDCENWNPDSTKAIFSPVTCDKWGCTDQGYYKWWMQNNPGYNNGITYQGKPMKNWWEAMYDFNAFINNGKSLLGNSLFSCFVTPTPSSTPISPTMTPTSTPKITIAPSGTGTDISASVTVCPHGLGNCGDNANNTGLGNIVPKHNSRFATLQFYDANNQFVNESEGPVNYNTTSQNFAGTMNTGSIAPGSYTVKLQMDGYLIKRFPNIVTITSTTTTLTLPKQSLTTGDINNDNQLDILDYNLLISCYGSKQSSSSCTTKPNSNFQGSDINDDGVINGIDYNLFLREFSVQKGG